MKPTTATLLIACSLTIGACSGSTSATAPTSAPGAPGALPVQAVATSIDGIVFDTLFASVADTSIEISDASGGVVSLLTDQNGGFKAAGSFRLPIAIRASKSGFRSETHQIDRNCCEGRVSTIFDLGFDGSTVTVQPGNYTLTFVSDSACTEIPEDLRVRTFNATIAPRSGVGAAAGRYVISISGPSVGTQSVALGVFGNRLKIADGDDTGFGIFETLPSFRYLSFGGGAEATVDESTVSRVSFAGGGDVLYCALNSAMPREKSCYNVPTELVTARALCRPGRFRITLEPK